MSRRAVGIIIAPVLAGWTIDTAGTYVWAFGLTVISAILSLLLLLPLTGAATLESPVKERTIR